MKSFKANLCLIAVLVVAFYEHQNRQGQIRNLSQPDDMVVQRVARFADGYSLSFQGKVKMGWQECWVFTGGKACIYVDAVTGQVTAAFYSPPATSAEKIGLKEAKARAETWLTERGISLARWLLEEEKVYDRGSLGKEYVFCWVKRSPKGIRLPCILKVAISEDGTIRQFWKVERVVRISLEPSIDVARAIKIAAKASGLTSFQTTRQELRVWFDQAGKQQLWWDITLQGGELERRVILNAHTGEVIAVLQLLKETPMVKAAREEAQRKATEVLKDLDRVVRIEILAYGPYPGAPLASPTKGALAQVVGVIDKKKDGQTFKELLVEMKKALKRVEPFAPLLATPFWLRLHLEDGKWIYHCRFCPKHDYLQVYTKEPWALTQKAEGKVVKIIRKRSSEERIYDWPPEGSVRFGIPCRATKHFKDIILKAIRLRKNP